MCKFNPKNEGRRIDPCIKGLIKWLNDRDYPTVACCCGHGKYPMTIVMGYRQNGKIVYTETLSGIVISRKKRIYKRDKQGYYYIPEVIDQLKA